jgi:EpsI family protein
MRRNVFTLTEPIRRLDKRIAMSLLQGGIVFFFYLAFYGATFASLVREWYEHENFSYGFLIPIIFIYLIWQERTVFYSRFAKPSWLGGISLGAAVLLGLIGNILGEPLLSRLSLAMAIGALVHLYWGGYAVKKLVFPLTYLFLMIPPPYPVVKEISYYLKMFDATVAANALQALGVPVFQDAYLLHLPNVTLEVADICSGIASLFAMTALGTIYAYRLPARREAQWMVVLGAAVFPIVANLFRIILIGFTVHHYGPVMLKSFFHQFTGTFTFLLGLAMLLILGEQLRRKHPGKTDSVPAEVMTQANLASSHWVAKPERGNLPFLVSSIIFAFAILVSNSSIPLSSDVNIRWDLESISPTLGPYRAAGYGISEGYLDPSAEKSLSRVYTSDANDKIELFVGYSSRQFGENRLSSPKLIFPSGWEYAAMGETRIIIPGFGPVDAIWLLTKKGNEKKMALYWYEVQGKAIASDLRNRLELIRGVLLHGRADGAVVRLATRLAEYEDNQKGMERLIPFSTYLYPELARVLPR